MQTWQWTEPQQSILDFYRDHCERGAEKILALCSAKQGNKRTISLLHLQNEARSLILKCVVRRAVAHNALSVLPKLQKQYYFI